MDTDHPPEWWPNPMDLMEKVDASYHAGGDQYGIEDCVGYAGRNVTAALFEFALATARTALAENA